MSEDCPHCVYEKNEANCLGCFEGSHYRPKPATNADRIRAMTDEELASYLTDVWYSLEEMPGMCDVCDDQFVQNCSKCWLDWLKQEATDGT